MPLSVPEPKILLTEFAAGNLAVRSVLAGAFTLTSIASTGPATVVGASDGTLLRSVDQETTFAAIAGGPASPIQTLEWATTNDPAFPTQFMCACFDGSIWNSNDAGVTFTQRFAADATILPMSLRVAKKLHGFTLNNNSLFLPGGVAFVTSLLVCSGLGVGNNAKIFRSLDNFLTRALVYTATNNDLLLDVASDEKGRWIAIGYNNITGAALYVVSLDDGLTWARNEIPGGLTLFFASNNNPQIQFFNGLFITTQSPNNTGTSPPSQIGVTTDGLTNRPVFNMPIIGFGNPQSALAGLQANADSSLIATGFNDALKTSGMYISRDGFAWKRTSVGRFTIPVALAFKGAGLMASQFIGVANNRQVLNSPNDKGINVAF